MNFTQEGRVWLMKRPEKSVHSAAVKKLLPEFVNVPVNGAAQSQTMAGMIVNALLKSLVPPAVAKDTWKSNLSLKH